MSDLNTFPTDEVPSAFPEPQTIPTGWDVEALSGTLFAFPPNKDCRQEQENAENAL